MTDTPTYLPFDQAREIARNLGFGSSKEWKQRLNEVPVTIPRRPDEYYRGKGWVHWKDFLNVSRNNSFLPFEEARAYAQTLNLKGLVDWRKFCSDGKRPDNIPALPDVFYRDEGWVSWKDFLGNVVKILPFKEARAFVHTLGLRTQRDWLEYCKSKQRPKNIPTNPNIYYMEDWVSVNDWLGSEPGGWYHKRIKYLTYTEASKLMPELGITSQEAYEEYMQREDRVQELPPDPKKYYFRKWTTWKKFLMPDSEEADETEPETAEAETV